MSPIHTSHPIISTFFKKNRPYHISDKSFIPFTPITLFMGFYDLLQHILHNGDSIKSDVFL